MSNTNRLKRHQKKGPKRSNGSNGQVQLERRSVGIQIGNAPGKVGIRFDTKVDHLDLNPAQAVAMARAIFTAAEKAHEAMQRHMAKLEEAVGGKEELSKIVRAAVAKQREGKDGEGEEQTQCPESPGSSEPPSCSSEPSR